MLFVVSAEISRSPEDVFTYLDEVERITEWQGPVLKVERLTDGPITVGSRVVYTVKRSEQVYEVVEHDPPRVVSVESRGGLIGGRSVITVEPLGGGLGSVLRAEVEFKGHGVIGKLLTPVTWLYAKYQLPKNLAKLKEVLEKRDDLNLRVHQT